MIGWKPIDLANPREPNVSISVLSDGSDDVRADSVFGVVGLEGARFDARQSAAPCAEPKIFLGVLEHDFEITRRAVQQLEPARDAVGVHAPQLADAGPEPKISLVVFDVAVKQVRVSGERPVILPAILKRVKFFEPLSDHPEAAVPRGVQAVPLSWLVTRYLHLHRIFRVKRNENIAAHDPTVALRIGRCAEALSKRACAAFRFKSAIHEMKIVRARGRQTEPDLAGAIFLYSADTFEGRAVWLAERLETSFDEEGQISQLGSNPKPAVSIQIEVGNATAGQFRRIG